MPNYTYKCKHCNITIHRLSKYTQKPPKCKKCGQSMVKIFEGVGFDLRGGGFYENDYKKKNERRIR